MTPKADALRYKTVTFFRGSITAFNIDKDDLLAEANLPRDFLDDGVYLIDQGTYARFIAALWARMPQTDLVTKTLYALQDSETFPLISPVKFLENGMQALSHFANGYDWLANVDTVINSDDHQVTLCTSSPLDNMHERKGSFIRLMFLLRLIRAATGTHIIPTAVSVAFDPLTEPSLQEFLGIAPSIGQTNSMSILLEDTRLPFTTADEDMYHSVRKELARRLDIPSDSRNVVVNVHNILLQSTATTQLNIDSVASQLGVSRRTLQRNLMEEGTKFTTVLEQFRRVKVEELISEGVLSKGEIAYQIGLRVPTRYIGRRRNGENRGDNLNLSPVWWWHYFSVLRDATHAARAC